MDFWTRVLTRSLIFELRARFRSMFGRSYPESDLGLRSPKSLGLGIACQSELF
jgi:hypothetical protein